MCLLITDNHLECEYTNHSDGHANIFYVSLDSPWQLDWTCGVAVCEVDRETREPVIKYKK